MMEAVFYVMTDFGISSAFGAGNTKIVFQKLIQGAKLYEQS
jgi:hypothetical protein